MSKKLVPRDKGRVEHAAKQHPAKAKAAVKTPARASTRSQASARRNPGTANRSRSAKVAPQKGGIAGFFQRLFGRFKR